MKNTKCQNAGRLRSWNTKRMYRLKKSEQTAREKVNLFGSGAILNEALKLQLSWRKYNLMVDIWSVTSYKELYDECQGNREMEQA
jgi:pyruvate dehydrogenase complex dehydrogenase (E1) component